MANRGSVELRPNPALISSDNAQSIESVCEIIENYYTARISKYGATPLGVDWTCIATQELRFVQLLKICQLTASFSLNDLGCGYGALIAYLSKRHADAGIDYLGVDLSAAMISNARRLYSHRPSTRFSVGRTCSRAADYSVGSGIFNVRLNQDFETWECFIAQTLLDMKADSRRGFSVNFMLPDASPDVPNEVLYRTTPERWTEFCEDRLDCRVETITNYGLREFTLLARPRNAEPHAGID
jgi:SAM-dependent methyltransferase